MKRVLILGSTGTIGVNTLKVIQRFPEHFQAVGLTAHQNVEILAEQTRIFKPEYIGISGRNKERFCSLVHGVKPVIFDSDRDLAEMCALKDVDIVVIGISGCAALEPFWAAVTAGKIIAPANKEALVIAGGFLMEAARRNGARIIPVDSEQSAIFQCLQGQRREDLKKVFLTASGGPLRNVSVDRFYGLKPEDVLRHPRWEMGPKITVDSATMMNKGFEVIEAQRLFDLRLDEIEVVVHPESIVHSMVCFQDGSVIAQLGITDMRIPIQYALTYPERWSSPSGDLDLFDLAQLNFERPDEKKFPALGLALEAAREGGTVPAVLNAANEIAVDAFLMNHIGFMDMYHLVERVVRRHKRRDVTGIESVLEADRAAREDAAQEMLQLKH